MITAVSNMPEASWLVNETVIQFANAAETSKNTRMKLMAVTKERFLTDAKGRRTAVVLDLPTYENLLEAKEEFAEIEAYDAARPRAQGEIKSGEFSTLAAYRSAHARKTK
jgi:hypothetical protein